MDIKASDTNPATGKAYAINPSSGVWDDNYFDRVYGAQNRTFAAQREAADPIAQARKLRQFNIESNQPQISSLQASIPETEQRFATERTRLGGEKEPLKQRYQNIIDQLTGREKQDIGMAQQRTGREFGARGIPASSSLYLDELMRAESPIRQAYGGQIKEVGLEQETGLRGIDQLISQLTGQETEQKRTIQNAIGQLQSGDPASAIQGAMQILSLQEQTRQNQTQNQLAQQAQSLSERQFGLQQEIARKPEQQEQFATLGEGQALYNLLSGQQLFKNQKTYAPKDQFGGNEWEFAG